MSVQMEVFEKMKGFIDFDDKDIQHLKALAPLFAKHGGSITDQFYTTLGNYPETAKLIEGRVDMLKATHRRWMSELFLGEYGEAYFQNRVRIGLAHVRIKLDPFYVEGVMSFLRTSGLLAIREEFKDVDMACSHATSFLKILDLDLLIINLAYGDERMDRLTKFTGMSRKLLERCVSMG